MKFAYAIVIAAAAGAMGLPASAQTPTPAPTSHVHLQKTIGQGKPQVVPSLIVINSRGVSPQGGKLTLTGVAPNSIVFADRPVRAAGHDLTSHIVDDWNVGADSFAKDPPNATVSGFSKDGANIRDVVVVLKSPKLEGDRLTFDVDVLEGDLAGVDGPASVFIDIIGRPFTPLSFAGVARRTAYRGAWYAGAAAAGAAAMGAAAAYAYRRRRRGRPAAAIRIRPATRAALTQKGEDGHCGTAAMPVANEIPSASEPRSTVAMDRVGGRRLCRGLAVVAPSSSQPRAPFALATVALDVRGTSLWRPGRFGAVLSRSCRRRAIAGRPDARDCGSIFQPCRRHRARRPGATPDG